MPSIDLQKLWCFHRSFLVGGMSITGNSKKKCSVGELQELCGQATCKSKQVACASKEPLICWWGAWQFTTRLWISRQETCLNPVITSKVYIYMMERCIVGYTSIQCYTQQIMKSCTRLCKSVKSPQSLIYQATKLKPSIFSTTLHLKKKAAKKHRGIKQTSTVDSKSRYGWTWRSQHMSAMSAMSYSFQCDVRGHFLTIAGLN